MKLFKNKLVIGYFGLNNNQIDGQTIKTKNVYHLLKTEYSNIDYFDTQDLKFYIIKYFVLLYKILSSKDIVLLPGKNSLKGILFLLYIIKILFRKNIYLFAVGGWLVEFINPKNKKYFNKIDYFFVESKRMKYGLQDLGLVNTQVFPNFRKHNFYPNDFNKKIKNDDTLRILFFARIIPEKGCDFILDFAEYYNNNLTLFKKKIVIDFYGPIDKSYSVKFNNRINNTESVNYCGYIDSEKVYKTISKYDINILPTFYEGEGFPGTIIDSYIAGVPMIVSDWKDLPEFVEEGKTGFILKSMEIEELIKILNTISSDSFLLKELKHNSYLRSKDYSYESAVKILKEIIK